MMTNKIIVKLDVPILEKKYDVFLPINKKIYNIVKLLVKALNEFSGESFNPELLPVLYDKITAEPYDYNLTVKESNIKNGTEIILI